MESIAFRLFGGFLILCGVWFIRHAHVARVRAASATGWPRVTGEVVSAEVRRKPGSNPIYYTRINYRYAVGGSEYASDKTRLGGELRGSRKKAELRCEKYAPGSTPQVFYNPADPEESYLEIAPGGLGLEVAGGAVGVLIGALLMGGFIPTS